MPDIFKAKKIIPQSEPDITSGRPVITPPIESTEIIDGKNVTITIPTTIDFQIKDVKPIEITDTEYKNLQTKFINVAKRAPNLTGVTKSISISKI